MTSLTLQAKRLVLRIIARLYAGRVIETKDGIRVRIGSDWIMGRVVWHKGYEMRWTKFVANYLAAGDLAVDVGANFGYYTLIMQKTVGDGGHVHAFEPNPRILGDLKANLQLNGAGARVSLHEIGLGEAATKAVMDNDDLSSGLGFTRTSATGDIEIRRMDDVLDAKAGHIALVKMDIEGNEIGALRGAEALLKANNPPVLLVEFNRDALERQGAGQATEFWELIKACGFAPYTLDGDSRVRGPIPGGSDAEEGNYLFLPDRGEFRNRVTVDAP